MKRSSKNIAGLKPSALLERARKAVRWKRDSDELSAPARLFFDGLQNECEALSAAVSELATDNSPANRQLVDGLTSTIARRIRLIYVADTVNGKLADRIELAAETTISSLVADALVSLTNVVEQSDADTTNATEPVVTLLCENTMPVEEVVRTFAPAIDLSGIGWFSTLYHCIVGDAEVRPIPAVG